MSARPNRHTAAVGGLHVINEKGLEDALSEHLTPLILVLDCITDPHNLGACLRSADAAGVTLVVLPKDKSAPLNETVRRVSCGGADHVTIAVVTNLSRTMERLKELGVWFVGTTDAATQSIYDIDLTGPIGIVVGAEGLGMRRLTQERCDFLAVLPMAGQVECLNVSVATGVCLYEAVRQRRAKSVPTA